MPALDYSKWDKICADDSDEEAAARRPPPKTATPSAGYAAVGPAAAPVAAGAPEQPPVLACSACSSMAPLLQPLLDVASHDAGPVWIDEKHVDSMAMFSAYLGTPGIQYEPFYGKLDMPMHRFAYGSRVAPVPSVNEVPCTAAACLRCKRGIGGYVFRWYSPRWALRYTKMARRGAWMPPEGDIEAAPPAAQPGPPRQEVPPPGAAMDDAVATFGGAPCYGGGRPAPAGPWVAADAETQLRRREVTAAEETQRDYPPPVRCGCMVSGRQCLDVSLTRSEPPRCHDCIHSYEGVCGCDCRTCLPRVVAARAESAEKGDDDGSSGTAAGDTICRGADRGRGKSGRGGPPPAEK
jgi:hypothetical protein